MAMADVKQQLTLGFDAKQKKARAKSKPKNLGAAPPQEPPRHRPRLRATKKYGNILYTHGYDGEKNFGEIGPIRSYLPQYSMLRYRSWQAYLESDLAQLAINRFATWVIGKGLKLQSEPSKLVLEAEGVNTSNIAKFSKIIEARYGLFCNSKRSDYAGMNTKNWIAKTAFVNAIVGGDCLVIQRYEKDKDTVTIEIVDGAMVQSSHFGTEVNPHNLANGNRIEHGIELSPRNEHVAYYVLRSNGTHDRIPARQGQLTTAFMVYGSRYRLDTHRGIPLIAVVLETIKKLERYKEATVGSAEEQQKIAYFFEHALGSDGSNPLIDQLAKLYDDGDGVPIDDVGNALADKVAASVNKQVFNLPINSTVKALEGKGQLYFKDFYQVNAHMLFSAIGIPPNVALQMYDASYSASRAAMKDWELQLDVKRGEWSDQFEHPIFQFWTFIETLKGTIQAPGLLEAAAGIRPNWAIIEAYMKARFVGASVPHVDPVKEVEAERAKLGAAGAAIPLTTAEQATESLGGGDFDSNMEQFANELEGAGKLKIEDPAVTKIKEKAKEKATPKKVPPGRE
jgi:capsid protein